ncbi:MAG TPA: hypothetical protein DD856_04860 [Sulfobacillus sp.]|nr:hypothetical protein [Sulfobacillus sp.]
MDEILLRQDVSRNLFEDPDKLDQQPAQNSLSRLYCEQGKVFLRWGGIFSQQESVWGKKDQGGDAMNRTQRRRT